MTSNEMTKFIRKHQLKQFIAGLDVVCESCEEGQPEIDLIRKAQTYLIEAMNE